ncbi:MAG TPA: ABC transporter substrate-binding protein, partial [Acidimicrobiales bacterium]|nr:ABC transporter substrate-binding protein [Acidimicrobiales bacterium]
MPRAVLPCSRRRRPVVALFAALGLVAGTACSSTVMRSASDDTEMRAGGDEASTAALEETTPEGTSTETSTGAEGSGTKGAVKTGAAGTTGGTAGRGGSSGGGSTGTGSGGGTGGGGGGGAGGGIAMSKGITDTTIHLGFPYADATAYNAAATGLGGNATFQGVDDPKGVQQAVIDWFNANGGIRGRKIVPVWHELKVSNAVTKEGRVRDAQTACATYTEDNKVFAYLGSGQWTEDNIVECGIRTKTVQVDMWSVRTGVWLSDKRFGEAGPYYYSLNGMSTERRERAVVESLARQGFFTPGARVGLLIEDAPSIRQGVANALKPALAARGVNVVTEAVYPDIIESPWDTYVLQFQTNTVTHVLFSASTSLSWPTLLFMRAAENQTWRPKYGIDGLPGIWLLDNAPKDQLRNTRGVAWVPGYLGETYGPVSDRDATCREIMKKKAYPETLGSPFCDYLFFLKDGLERADALTPAGLAA